MIALDARLAFEDSTGDSTYWTGLLLALAARELPFRIVAYSHRPRPSRLPANPRLDWAQLPMGRFGGRGWSLWQWPLAARRSGANLLHTQYSLSPLVGNRGITTVHDISFLLGPQWFSARDRAILSRTVPAACARARRVVTVSRTSAEEIARLIPTARGKTVSIYNARHPFLTVLTESEGAVRRERLGITGPYVASVSTRWPRKNMELAVRAMDDLPTDLPHQLILTGKAGWGDQSVGKRARATGYLEWDDLAAVYQGASLYLCPSHHEGFGIPVVEAFALGAPVLASAGGALPEVVGEAGVVETSWLSSDWTNRIATLLRDPRKLDAMRAAGLAREREFSWTRSAEQHLALWETALTETNGRN